MMTMRHVLARTNLLTVGGACRGGWPLAFRKPSFILTCHRNITDLRPSGTTNEVKTDFSALRKAYGVYQISCIPAKLPFQD